MTNAAALGYMILAAEGFGLSRQAIEIMEVMMKGIMDVKTEEEAEQAYNKN